MSCIYGIGEKEEYRNKMLNLSTGMNIDRNKILQKLVEMLYERNNLDLKRGSFRVRGDILEIVPISQHNHAIRIEFFGDEIDKICEVDALTGKVINSKKSVTIFPASHFVTSEEKLKIAIKNNKTRIRRTIRKV